MKPKATGRPAAYEPQFAVIAGRLAMLGLIDKEIAAVLGVAESTFHTWKKRKDFSESLKRGKDFADGNVAESLYKRAMGYSHPDTHIAVSQGAVIKTPIIKHYPPDVAACIFWLKNRRPALWRERSDSQSQTVVNVVNQRITPEDIAAARVIASELQKLNDKGRARTTGKAGGA